MGVIVIDARTALQFKGSIARFEKAVVELAKFQKCFDSLNIEIIPQAESAGICIEVSFSGSIAEFEKINAGLGELKESVAIDTVPLPERVAIGTWPTPEKPATSVDWIISASAQSRQKY